MRIRSIKPEFWRSEDINALSIEDRLLFIGLWSYVDDNGVGRDAESCIAADLFAGDLFRNSRETFARLSRGLQHLADAGLIVRYEVDGKRYLAVVTWEKHQKIDRPNKPRFPQYSAIRDTLATPSRESRDNSATGTEEQRNRGTGEQTLSRAPARGVTEAAWETFWELYPRKVSKKDARAVFDRIARTTDLEVVINGAARYANDPNRPTGRFIMHPDKWLRGEHWNDDPCPPRDELSRSGSFFQSELARIEQQEREQRRGNVIPLQLGAGA